MNFLEQIFDQLAAEPDRERLREMSETGVITATAGDLLRLTAQARAVLRSSGLRSGDRCGLLASNSIRWVAIDLALMAEGVVVVPLYSRQSAVELVRMLQDCEAAMVCCGDEKLRGELGSAWGEGAPPLRIFDEIFVDTPTGTIATPGPMRLKPDSLVTIIYTSGTSGEPKGVMLNAGNLDHMIPCTGSRLDLLMESRTSNSADEIFHYLPFCFAGSWILLLTALSRNSRLSLSMDLNRLADELRLAEPNYFLNVPTLLERIRTGVEASLASKSPYIQSIYRRGRDAWERRRAGTFSLSDTLWWWMAKFLIFRTIQRKVGPSIRALICGSAPLARETQLFFLMIGIRVLQVYGLTETTAICTMDDPRRFSPGRVGPAIPGIEMKHGEGGEIMVKGPHLFAGYWNRPEATAAVLQDGWFKTGDLGEIDADGNWSIIGRIKNLIILNSGHNVAPEPIEEKILFNLPAALQCVVVGNDRSFLTAIITGQMERAEVEAAVELVNRDLPHYKRVLAFHLRSEPMTIEGGLLTANGKIRRDAVVREFSEEIEQLYRTKRT